MDLETYQFVKASIFKILTINLDHYKDEQMKRRLDSWLSRVGAKDWEEYFGRVKRDDVELRKFRDYLTINVTEFFRDPERWQYLRDHIIPDIMRPGKSLRVWSAGCSKGAEIYSTAMILEEMSPGKKHYLSATDLDLGALETAMAGGPFVPEEVRNVSPIQRSMYFKPGGPPHFLNDILKKKITFNNQDLLKDEFEKEFDLIICRNVVIYFTTDTKQMLYEKFFSALRVGGVLFVGGTEIIPHPQDIGYRSSGFSFYYRT